MKYAQHLFLSLLLAVAGMLGGCAEPDPPTIGLYRAVHIGDLDQIERHIHWGTDINQTNPDGEKPLHVAARKGRWVVVELLLKHGAEVDALSRTGRTPLYVAVMEGRTQVAELLIGNGARFEPDFLLSEAVKNGVFDKDALRFLVNRGANINQRDEAGQTPLLIAISNGQRRVAKQLILLGADVNLPGGDGTLPLGLAMQRNAADLITLLRRNGARSE